MRIAMTYTWRISTLEYDRRLPGGIEMSKKLSAIVAVVLVATSLALLDAQAPEPYKLGMFRQNDRTFVGLVLRDSVVVDLSRAGVNAPPTLKELIARWDPTVASRLAKLAAEAGKQRPAYAFDLKQVKTLPPIPDPVTLLSAAVNYQEHAIEMRSGSTTAESAAAVDPKVGQGIPGLWRRKPNDVRHNPYMFPKLQAAITGEGDPIIIPGGRDRVDWECELAVVVGKKAKRVSADQARDFIFGYTLMNDVSDRGGRPDGRHGSDWLIGKSHDTFAPLGPFIVPREFVPDPQKLAIKFTLSGKVMQDSNTDRMTHNVYEVLEYASHVVGLQPGDILSTGSPAGVGTARETPIYMKAGDTSVCTIEGIGTLTNPVQAEQPKQTQ
jgi:2-keto-4-pentenoate hydratase/2-oxohepta-3-ene-1,7-dioic acid hydratase in catechol pathway